MSAPADSHDPNVVKVKAQVCIADIPGTASLGSEEEDLERILHSILGGEPLCGCRRLEIAVIDLRLG